LMNFLLFIRILLSMRLDDASGNITG